MSETVGLGKGSTNWHVIFRIILPLIVRVATAASTRQKQWAINWLELYEYTYYD